MRWVSLHLPEFASHAVVWAVTLVFALWPGRPQNTASMAYLERALGRRPGLADRHRHALTFGLMMRDRARLLARGTEGFEIRSAGEEPVHATLAEKRGAVLLGAHFGSFEAMRAFDRLLPDLRVRYMMYPDAAAASSAVYGELNPEVAARVIPLAQGPQSLLAAYEALQSGEFVAFLGDRVPDAGARAQVAAPFLGGQIWLPTSPYLTAMAAEVPLILCFAPRTGRDRYDIEFKLLHDGRPVPKAARRALAADLALGYARTLEDLCRAHPYNWFNFFDIWERRGDLPAPDARDHRRSS